MRFSVLRDNFLRTLRAVAGVVERKHTQVTPVLMNVLIQVQGDSYSLTTTDQEVELVSRGLLEAPAVEDGSVTVPVRKLMDVCKALSEGETLSVVEEQERVTIRAGRSRFVLSTLPATDFPCLNEHVGQVSFSINPKKLKHLIEQTSFAMAEQDVRYYLNGLLLEVKQGHLYSVAADGHRLAYSKTELALPNDYSRRVIIPRKGILELLRLLEVSEQEIDIVLGDNHIRVIGPDSQLTSKLLDGRFPDYERILFTEGNKEFVAVREALKESFQRAGALFSDRFRGVRLRLTPGNLKILAVNAEQDEVEEDIGVDYSGEELEVGFNIKYLVDFLTVIPTERVRFTLMDSNSSARVEGVGAEDALYVIMPMRI